MTVRQQGISTIDPELVRRFRRKQLWTIPLRMVIGQLIFSLPAGGPHRFYAELPGVVFGLLFIVQTLLELAFQAPDTGGKKADSASIAVAWLGFAVTLLLSVGDWFQIQKHFSLWTWNHYWLGAGIALMVTGQLMRVVAIRTLGAFFTASVRLHEGHRVIQHGLYSWIRHPAYTGLLLTTLGYVTLFGSLPGYISLLLFTVPSMINRIQVEERALVSLLGEDYKQYRRRVKRLIPFVY